MHGIVVLAIVTIIVIIGLVIIHSIKNKKDNEAKSITIVNEYPRWKFWHWPYWYTPSYPISSYSRNVNTGHNRRPSHRIPIHHRK